MLRLLSTVLLCCSFSLPCGAQSIWDYFLPEDQLHRMMSIVDENRLEYSAMEMLLAKDKTNYQANTLLQFLDDHPGLTLNELFQGRYLIAEMLRIERYDLAMLLIDRGCDPNFLSGKGHGALHDAINNDSLPAVKFLLATKRVNVNLFSSEKGGERTPLMRAVPCSIEIFNAILSHPDLASPA